MLQQDLNHLCIAAKGGMMQRGIAIILLRVGISSMTKK
jgi:hypothetical protein